VRSDEQSIFKIGLFSNRPLIAAECISLGFVAAVSYSPDLQSVFNTAPLRPGDWLLLFSWGALLLACEEARKAWRRSRRRHGQPQSPAIVAEPAGAKADAGRELGEATTPGPAASWTGLVVSWTGLEREV